MSNTSSKRESEFYNGFTPKSLKVEQPKMLKDLSYAEIKALISDLPLTWYPDLLKTLVETSIAKGCWLPGGATAFVGKIESAAPVPAVNKIKNENLR